MSRSFELVGEDEYGNHFRSNSTYLTSFDHQWVNSVAKRPDFVYHSDFENEEKLFKCKIRFLSKHGPECDDYLEKNQKIANDILVPNDQIVISEMKNEIEELKKKNHRFETAILQLTEAMKPNIREAVSILLFIFFLVNNKTIIFF